MVLYFTSGATDYEICAPALPDARWAALKETACRLINTRGNVEAANFLRRTPFKAFEATNHFGDEFTVLALDVNLDDYVAIQEWRSQSGSNLALQNIVRTLGEVGVAVRMVVADILADDAVEPVPHPELIGTSAAVERALDDAQHLMNTSGAISAVDRLHTALHGYLRQLCIESRAATETEANGSAQELLGRLVRRHPMLVSTDPHADQVRTLLRCFGGIVESINQFRNNGSVAHPNANLLGQHEAMLAINSCRTVLHYISSKLRVPTVQP